MREYLLLSIIVDKIKNDMDDRKSVSNAIMRTTGSFVYHRLKTLKDELRAQGIQAWVEYQGDTVTLHTSKRGLRESQTFSRRELDSELRIMIDKISDEIEHIQIPNEPYKVAVPNIDPYSKK